MSHHERADQSTLGAQVAEPVVEVDQLWMRYGELDVLTGVSFAVARGEIVALLGPNGAGKTTIVEILEGFRVRSAGALSVLGVDPATAGAAWRARIGVVLQSWRDHPRWTPRTLLSHLGRYYEPYSTADRPRPWPVADLISLVGLEDQADTKINTLSGGQRRRMDVAVGIVGRPDVLFLDEPTAGLDLESRRTFHELVHRLAHADRTTVLLTTHDLGEAGELADRILILAGGHIVADGHPDELGHRIAGRALVRWRRAGHRHERATPDPVAFVRKLLADHDDVDDLEVRRPSLEETYLAMVHGHEVGQPAAAPSASHTPAPIPETTSGQPHRGGASR